jgi:hypothetical protein
MPELLLNIALEEVTMPPHTRSQRRRQPARTGTRPPRETEVAVESAAEPALEMPPAPAAPVAAGARGPRQTRRAAARVLAPVDYSQDYAAARHDLIRIAVISIVLFAAMIGLGLSGIL